MSGTRKREQPQGTMWLNAMIDLLKGGALGSGAALIVLMLAACLIWGGLLNDGIGNSAVTAACLIGGFVGGMFVVQKGATAPLVGGIASGLVLFLLLLSVGVLAYDALPGLRSGGVAGACLCGGGLAGVLGKSDGTKKRRKRKM